jgi:KaiC/GvpD/RAD55 family RecA-like ATPase
MKKSSNGSKLPAVAMAANPDPPASDERICTGVHGLDGLLGGGFPVGSFILLSGTCGTGKSIMGMQFVYRGAEAGEPGVYLSMEEEPKRFIGDMSKFGWNVQKYVDEGKLSVLKPELYESDTIKRNIVEAVERTGARRLVIDSFTLLSSYLEKPFDVRKMVFDLSREAKKLNCTTLAISDMSEGGQSYSADGFEEFVSDGVVVLSMLKAEAGAYNRALQIRKMRATAHSLKLIPFRIERHGIMLHPKAGLFR